MPPETHAILSASSSARWLRCTPAPRLEAQFPEATSSYAEEGRVAHALAELKARKKFTPMGARAYNAAIKKIDYPPEMDGATDEYIDRLTEAALAYPAPPVVLLEQRVDFSEYVPEGFGTADCLMLGGDLLTVIDFKYGQGVPVDSEHNSQMMLYGLGALAATQMFFGDLIQRVRLMIIQPRINNSSTWDISRAELEQWGRDTVKPRAQLAYAGEGDFAPGEDTCRFCRAKAQCAARAKYYLKLEPVAGQEKALLSDAEIGDVLVRAQGLRDWAEDLKAYALDAVLAGRNISGWKAVEGRSNRAFDDANAAIEAIINSGVPRELIYDQVPKTLAALEKLIGKDEFSRIAGEHIVRPAGKPALVVESDKRPALNPAAAAFGGEHN